ncbi:hypothetical protein C5167_030775 [Papaver somniferum]|nr:hypothetical protein C5167_030775 [Papaver somniferum]
MPYFGRPLRFQKGMKHAWNKWMLPMKKLDVEKMILGMEYSFRLNYCIPILIKTLKESNYR